jgi:hypothetical protein
MTVIRATFDVVWILLCSGAAILLSGGIDARWNTPGGGACVRGDRLWQQR